MPDGSDDLVLGMLVCEESIAVEWTLVARRMEACCLMRADWECGLFVVLLR